jgi:hypothetical protein
VPTHPQRLPPIVHIVPALDTTRLAHAYMARHNHHTAAPPSCNRNCMPPTHCMTEIWLARATTHCRPRKSPKPPALSHKTLLTILYNARTTQRTQQRNP